MIDSDRRCEEILEDGTRCGAYKISGSSYCFMHDPGNRTAAQRARKKGGKRQWAPDPASWHHMNLKTLDDCRSYLEMGLNLVAQGKIAPAQLQAMASGIQAMAKIIDMSDLDRRIEALERKVNR